MIDEARELWEELTKTRSNSYAVWYGAADFETYVPIPFLPPPIRSSDLIASHTLQPPRRLR